MTARVMAHPHRYALTAVLLTVAVSASAQTQITPDNNKYTPAEDVKIGREAAQEVRRELPMLDDGRVEDYIDRVGERLVAAIPAPYRHNEFDYTFDVVNQKEINAFALPGGPMFVHRGMIEAAKSEGEVAGVMAHEIAHVALRHGTAQATKAEKFQIGAIAGQVLGAIVGGGLGSVIAQGSQFGLGTYFLKYGREYEREADLLGAQIMAGAGYDPRRMADMFRTIEKQSGGGGPEWLSSHPNPGNRTQYINEEAELLTVATAPDDSGFSAVRAQLASLPPATSMADLARGNAEAADGAPSAVGTPGQPVPRPSGQYRELAGGKVFRAAVPAEWTTLPSKSAIKVVPQNGYSEINGQAAFTHGVEFGITKATSRDLQEATNAWLNAVARNNPDLRLAGQQQSVRISQRTGLATPLTNPSPLGGVERIAIYTTFLADGTLFYYFTVVPEHDAEAFQDVFRRVGESIRLTEVR
jgi:hypothetical protein